MRYPDRWLALLRLTVGLWFIKSLFTKVSIAFVAGVIPVPVASERWIATMPKLITKYAADNPFPAYKAFLLDTVVPNHAFAHLTALGEAAIGISLALGLLTELGAAFGAMQVILYGLAVQHMSSGQQGFHVMLLAMMVAFFFAHAGRRWGLDAWLWPRLSRHAFDWHAPSATRPSGARIALVLVLALGVPGTAARGQLLLATNEGSNSVSVIEGNKVVATIPVGNRPRGLAISRDGKRAYVALGRDDAVAAIDIATRRVIDRIPVGNDPEQVAVDAHDRLVYVSNEALDSASAVAVDGHALRFRVAVGKEPEGVTLSPDGEKVYVTGESDSSVTVLNAATGRRLGVIHVSRRPRFMAFSPRGDWALVSTEDGGTVHVVNTRRDSIIAAIVIGDGTTKPTGIAISPDGRWAYVANGRSNQVSVLDMQDRKVVASIPVGERPWGVALSHDGSTLYVATGRANAISVISTSKRAVTGTIPVGERPYTVAIVGNRE
jgi:YVTN family beta-propeller protein